MRNKSDSVELEAEQRPLCLFYLPPPWVTRVQWEDQPVFLGKSCLGVWIPLSLLCLFIQALKLFPDRKVGQTGWISYS